MTSWNLSYQGQYTGRTAVLTIPGSHAPDEPHGAPRECPLVGSSMAAIAWHVCLQWVGSRQCTASQQSGGRFGDQRLGTACGIDGPSAGAAGDVAADVMLDRRCSLWVVRIRSQRPILTGNGDICGCRRAIAHSSLHLQFLCKQQGARPDLRPALVAPNSGLISTVARRAVLLRSRP